MIGRIASPLTEKKIGLGGFESPTPCTPAAEHVFYDALHCTTPMKAALHKVQHYSTRLYTIPLQNCYTRAASRGAHFRWQTKYAASSQEMRQWPATCGWWPL